MPILWLVGLPILFVAVATGVIYLNRFLLDRKVSQLLGEHQYGPALELLQERLQKSPNNPRLLILIGECYLAEGDLIRAQEIFDRAVKLDPGQAGGVAQEYFDRGKDAFDADATAAQQAFAMAFKYDASQGPQIGARFYAKGVAAFQLRDMNSADALFQQATQFDPSLKGKVASEYATCVSADPDFSDLDGAERCAKQAVSYDPATAGREGQALFGRLAGGLCNLHALGKKRFLAMMKLPEDLGLPDASKETLPYRFAYAIEVYENGPKPQGIDLLRDIVRDSSKSCEGIEANYVLSPPPPGRIMVTGTQPVSVGDDLTVQLLYVDVTPDNLKLTFSIKAGDQKAEIWYAKPGKAPSGPSQNGFSSSFLYILDQNGAKLETTSGWYRLDGGNSSKACDYPCSPNLFKIPLEADQSLQLAADFPLPTPGSNAFGFVAPPAAGQWMWGNWAAVQWRWPETKIKRDLFE